MAFAHPEHDNRFATFQLVDERDPVTQDMGQRWQVIGIPTDVCRNQLVDSQLQIEIEKLTPTICRIQLNPQLFDDPIRASCLQGTTGAKPVLLQTVYRLRDPRLSWMLRDTIHY